MAYIHIDSTAPAATVFEAIFRLFGRMAPRRNGAGAETGSPVTDQRTLRVLSRLGDEQLHDIGIRREARHVRSDYLARSPLPPPVVTFDYFHACV